MSRRLSLADLRELVLDRLGEDWVTPTDMLRLLAWSRGGGARFYVVALRLERMANDGEAEIRVSGKSRRLRRAP